MGNKELNKNKYMKAAITYLEQTLAMLENNEPIHRAEGNIEQADLCGQSASEIRQGLAVLRAAESVPIWIHTH